MIQRVFRAVGRKVMAEAVSTENEDGSTSITMGGVICEVSEDLDDPEDVAKWLAKLIAKEVNQ